MIAMTLTKEQIINADDLKVIRVPVPEWGGDVYVRTMTAAERDKLESWIVSFQNGRQQFNMSNFRAKIAALVLCDESGKRLFTDSEAELLASKSAAALNRILEAALSLNAMTASEIEQLASGLKKDQPGDLHSG